MEIVGFKLKIFQNYLFAGQPTNSLTAYSEKLNEVTFYPSHCMHFTSEILSQVIWHFKQNEQPESSCYDHQLFLRTDFRIRL